MATKCIIKQAHKNGEVDFTGTDAIQRVLWEAKLLEEFRNIAYFPKLRGSFEHCGDHFLVLEALRGRSLLNRLVAGENFSVPQVLTIGAQLCKALECVHRQGAFCETYLRIIYLLATIGAFGSLTWNMHTGVMARR